ncbi:MAG: hypothetical protein WBD00_00635 [Candidatus Omnitrophota bacterium]
MSKGKSKEKPKEKGLEAKSKKSAKGASALKRAIPVVVALIVVAVAFYAVQFVPRGHKVIPEFQKGMGYVTWSEGAYKSENSDKSLAEVKEVGTEWVSVLVTWYQTTPWSGDIHRTGKTPSDESVVYVIRKAHEMGMKVCLKMHLDLLDTSDGSWRGEIGCMRESEWDEWFRKYTEYIMHYAKIAEGEKVEMLCVGTELSTTATAKGYMWEDLIQKVRGSFSGLLVYAAHWDRYLDIRFWQLLDFVGINAYFPLTEEMAPSYEELKQGWTKWVAEIEEFQSRIQKPIIFPEAGCNSADGAAIRPWEHVPRSEVNIKLQEDYYRALLDEFWDKEWFYGLYWWYWGTNEHMGGQYNRGFTPQNKLAEEVIKKWYSKPVSR